MERNTNKRLDTKRLRYMTSVRSAQFADLYSTLWKTAPKVSLEELRGLRVAIYVNPCNGFGDIIFALKFHNYIMEWYDIKSTIVTTKPKAFYDNGLSDILGVKIPGKGYEECENVRKMKLYNTDPLSGKFTTMVKKRELPKFDLIFAAPWIGTDFKPNYNDLKKIFPYSNRFNTFLLSEYNPDDPSLYDFATGISTDNSLYGIFINKSSGSNITSSVSNKLPRPYIMVHITDDNRVDVQRCLRSFVKLMMKKYHKKHHSIDFVIASHVVDNEEFEYNLQLMQQYAQRKGFYEDFVVVRKGDQVPPDTAHRTIFFRTDITPLPYKDYSLLFNKALPDTLITGDQSVSDVVSCCKNFNIFYQTMPWKRFLAANLGKVLNADYLRRTSSSCGLEKLRVKSKGGLGIIAKKYSFERLAKKKLDGIFSGALDLRSNAFSQQIVSAVLSSRKKRNVLAKLGGK